MAKFKEGDTIRVVRNLHNSYSFDNAEFYRDYLGKQHDIMGYRKDHQMQWDVVSKRNFGQPKLRKPTELKNVKQSVSINFISGKCKFGIFIHNNNVWIQCRDYFSQAAPVDIKLMGTPLNMKLKALGLESKTEKFVYADNWADVVLRNEAWICVRDMLCDVRKFTKFQTMQTLKIVAGEFYGDAYVFMIGDWNRFLDNLAIWVWDYVRKVDKDDDD